MTQLDSRIVEAFPFAQSNWVVLAHAGSNAHGTVLPKHTPGGIDDVDYLGCFQPPAEFVLGLDRKEDWQLKIDELDVITYDLTKLVRLWLKSNPNVLGLLWTPWSNIIVSSHTYELFRENREAFVSKSAYHAFVGYAKSQLRRMTSGQLYEGYMGVKRRALVDQFGYDPKNACHLIRLLHMGIEFLESGELHVSRIGIDAEELKRIKRGDYQLMEIKTAADALFARAEEAYQQCQFPDKPDKARVNQLLIACQKGVLCH